MLKYLNQLVVWTNWKHSHRKMCIDKMSLRENGADFYGLPRNEEYVELREEEWR